MKDPLRIKAHPLHEDIMAYAVTYSMTRDREIDSEELRKFAVQLMKSISASCTHQGAKVIGHVKAYIEHETGFLHANTVGERDDVTVNGRDGDPVNRFTLVVNSIIYGLSEEAVKSATEKAIEEVSASFGLRRERVKQDMSTGSIS